MAEVRKKLGAKTNLKIMNEVEEMFKKFDRNGDGKISSSELGSILNSLGSITSPAEVKQIMTEIDTDGDGVIDLKEFEAFYCAGGGEESKEQEIRDSFDLYDKDKNAKISANELQSVLKSIGEKCSLRDCQRMIRSVDIDGDGCVNFEEFKRMMNRT